MTPLVDSMWKFPHPNLQVENKGLYVLQQLSFGNKLRPQNLSLEKATVQGNHAFAIFKHKDMMKSLNKMTDLLSLSNILEAIYLKFEEDKKLI